ncbi:hypothetical protein [Hoeflea alexandrii]|uniref:DUF2213 domain-containing protein n=1 Tax=Hoeflea alexandrii TaxID=288436 RepID=A0ABT1CMB3_9HYPH|nr:hypothetical protein [Hoeflea alexandrii]MCO6407351.1 hypothetical protein [Hoeflea alexandrii]MCY0154252.1 hypothetical protein [Hoeflea alexandrii]
MTKKIRVNIRSLANVAAVRKEKRNGRDVVIVPSATLPDDIVMNGIKYPADEIAKSFMTLNRTPAPFGHPKVNGKFVSARDPEGINVSYVGAWNENVRREGGRVLLDKVIDVAIANQSENGKAVLEAIDKGEPVHTSTGLLCELGAANGDDHKHTAMNIMFDHDAILLNEDGAATPDQGVGMLVNASGEAEEIEVINSAIDEADRDLDWALDSAVRALEKRQRAPLMERLKTALIEAFRSERETQANEKDIDMPIDEKAFDALSAKVNSLSEAVDKIPTTVAEAMTNAVKPLVEAQEALVANQKAKDEAELAELQAKIVKANILDEEGAKELTLNAARKLAEKVKVGNAAGVNSAFKPGADNDEWAGYDLNANIKTEKGAA